MTAEEVLERDDFPKCADFHGHICPGLAIGYRAAKAALDWLKERRAIDEEMVAFVETDACGTDALQVLTGCTVGKGNLIQKDYGKHVYTIVSRRSGQGVRVALKAGALKLSERHQELVQRIRSGGATGDERREFWELHHQSAREILDKRLEGLFNIRPANMAVPPKAMIEPSRPCKRCGEPTMLSRLTEVNGFFVCRDCLEGE